MEFSKKILMISYITAILLTIAMFVTTFYDKDVSSISNTVLACWAEVTVGNAFYYWKARAENKIKILSSVKPEILDKMNHIDINKDY